VSGAQPRHRLHGLADHVFQRLLARRISTLP